MSAPYIVIAGYINDQEVQHIVGLYLTKAEAESEGTKYVKEFPGQTVNIYSWEMGMKSSNIVNVEREWYSGFEVPVAWAPAPESSAMYPNTDMPIAEEPSIE